MYNRCQETSIKSRNKMDVVSRTILDHVCDSFGYVTYFALFPDQWLDPTLNNGFITRDLIFTVNCTIGWTSQKKESFFVLEKILDPFQKRLDWLFRILSFEILLIERNDRLISALHSVLSFFKIYEMKLVFMKIFFFMNRLHLLLKGWSIYLESRSCFVCGKLWNRFVRGESILWNMEIR